MYRRGARTYAAVHATDYGGIMLQPWRLEPGCQMVLAKGEGKWAVN